MTFCNMQFVAIPSYVLGMKVSCSVCEPAVNAPFTFS